MKKIGVVGAGSWGTALAITLADKGHQVNLWDLNQAHLADLKENRENKAYLPGIVLSQGIDMEMELSDTLEDRDLVIFAAPAQHFRSALTQALPSLKNQILVNVAKGIEQKTLKLMSQIAEEVAPQFDYVALSGPSHAEEVGQKLPTTVSVAGRKEEAALAVQETFITDRFRVYTNRDILGVELGGALKNIIALGAGISDGMGFGDNAKAALMTRGIAEIARLGEKMGADKETFLGLAGIGDLIVTCTSMHSRNRRCGIMIGQGIPPRQAIEKVGMVVEGMYTTEAAYQLSRSLDVEMPITEVIYQVVYEGLDAKLAADALMRRDKKHE
jgi:glycerol-3-phosphate dehydrogenase (NAD(P)+)